MKAAYAAPTDLLIALDIGKNVHWLGCYDGQLTELVAPHEVRTDLAGFAHFRQTVDPLLESGQFNFALMGNEPTGVYHEPWAWQIREHYLETASSFPIAYHWINPVLTKRRQRQHSIRQRTTDRRAVLAIAACLRDDLGYPAHFPTPLEGELRETVRARQQLHQQRRYLARRLYPQIDRLWPGAQVNVKRFQEVHPDLAPPRPLVKSEFLKRKSVAALFLHCPDPYAALDLGVEGLIAFLREHVGRGGPKTAQKILSVLHNAPLPPPAVAARYAIRLQADFEAYTALKTRLADLDARLQELVPQTDARFLASVPGISAVLAARYLAAIRTVDRFPSAAHIWSFAGLDPISAESGDSKRVGKISKKGPATFRDTLFQIGQHTRQYCAPIGEAFLRARARGKAVVPATIHAAHKANRLCFALLRDRRGYRPVAPARQARFQARWAAYQAR